MTAPAILFVVLCFVWGSSWMFIKLGLEDLPPFTFAGLRFVIATLVLGAIVAYRRVPLPRTARDWRLIAITGSLGIACNYGLLFWGEQHIDSGLAAVLQATIPVFGLVIAHIHLPGERMDPRKVAGVLLGLGGVAFIFSDQFGIQGPLALQGSIAVVVGAFAAAYANVLVKARGGHLHPAVLAGGQMLVGLAPLLLIGAAFEVSPGAFRWTPLACFSLVYLALVPSALAFFLYYRLVRIMDVTKTMLIALVTPLVAVFLGMVLLGEGLTLRVVIGGAAILGGIATILARRIRHG